MPSSPTPGRITSAEWHENSPDKTSYTNMCQPEKHINQRDIPTRDVYRPDTHHPKKGHTISQNRDSFAMPRTVERNMASHVYPQSNGWRPTGVCHRLKKGGMKSAQKCGTTVIRSRKTDERWDRKIERKGKTQPN
ncbi:hypothetical protein AB3S75_022913 [Citrus x aurantiifolia]